MTTRPTVAIIGAGFSGLLTALRLLIDPDGPAVVLIERGPRFGRGAAYSTGNPDHLLNVRASNMSAIVEQPGHFIDWLRADGVREPDRAFVTRDRYGRYLQALLRQASTDAGPGRLTFEHDDVVGARTEGGAWRLELGVGREIGAQAVVLALGNLPPPPPPALDPALKASPRFVGDPWAWRGPAGLEGGEILLLGSGLTAVDVALSIESGAPNAAILALSRRGLTPLPHGEAGLVEDVALPPEGSPLRWLRRLRRLGREDWRGAVDTVRPHVQAIWRGWSLKERRQFLRHLRPWWNIHRHRLAPDAAGRIAAMKAAGRLRVEAGRLDRLELRPDGVLARWRAKGTGEIRERLVTQVVNCTGPRGDLAGSGDALLRALQDQGLARTDACDLGLDVDQRSRVLGADGAPVEGLFAVGPLTRGQFFEVTSVPDIRLQAADCADTLRNSLMLKRQAQDARSGEGADRLAAELSRFLDETIAELDVELGALQFARRIRNAWELRGRRAALSEIALWLESRRDQGSV